MIETAKLPEGLIRTLSPPSKEKKKLVLSDYILLMAQLLWIFPLIIMDFISDVIRGIFPSAGKSLTGQVALVTGGGRGLGRGLALRLAQEGCKVTGGGRGLGRGLALRLAQEGCKVAVVDINISNARGTANDIMDAEGVAKAYQCNVASPEAIKGLREAVTSDLGPVDILVNNAGIVYGGDLLEDCDKCDIKAVMDVNLMSHFWTIQEFLPAMKERNGGHLVAIGSIASFLAGERGCAYITSKFGVRALMEVVRSELGLRPHNSVRTTTVYPYFVNTSADYLAHWKLRVPPIAIEDVVEATISGIRRNEVSVFVPSYYEYFVKLFGLLPSRSYDRVKKVIDCQVKPFEKENSHEKGSSMGLKNQ